MSQPTVTFTEASALIRQLEPRCAPPSYWQIRDLDQVLGVIDPACVVMNDRVRNRLLDPLDVMLLRLWTRIGNTSCQPGWVAGAVIARHRDELRRIFRRGQARALVLRGLRSEIVHPEDANQPRGECYQLSDVPDGVAAAMRAVRAGVPLVWDGCRRTRPSNLTTVPSSSAVRLLEVPA